MELNVRIVSKVIEGIEALGFKVEPHSVLPDRTYLVFDKEGTQIDSSYTGSELQALYVQMERMVEDPNLKLFVFHWLHGTDTKSIGIDVANAFANAGYGGGAINILDYYEEISLFPS